MVPSSPQHETATLAINPTSPPSPSTDGSMDGEGAVMQEEDADILERGVLDGCSVCTTPVLPPVLASKTIPSFSLSAIEGLSQYELESDGNFTLLEEEAPSAAFRIRNDPSTSIETLGQEESSININQQHSLYESNCIDENFQYIDNSENFDEAISVEEEEELSFSLIPVTRVLSSESNAIAQTSVAPVARSGLSKRSLSYDRRMNEAVQFAEAVGETPPLCHNDARVIIEETESDYDDDSDNEICVDAPSIAQTARGGFQFSVPVLHPKEPVDDTEVSEDFSAENAQCLANLEKEETIKSQWALIKQKGGKNPSFLHRLPAGVNTQTYVYKGILSNPPEITKRGISRGNYSQLHRKAWLEVSDKYHRYGKNLRLYYKHWETLNYPTNQFFDWLDSKGEAAGRPLPNLEECPRSQLDSDTVLYISNPDTTEKYELLLEVDEKGRALVYDTSETPVHTGTDGWIFVLRDGKLYGTRKVTSVSGHSKQRFHHSSFFSGKAVAAAGILITNEEGVLKRVYPHSGHYRPGEADMQRMLFHLHDKNVDLRTFDVDIQQILHVTRDQQVGKKKEDGCNEKKKKKIQSLYLKPALYLARFLAHKARLIRWGIFDQIHKCRKFNASSVSEALQICDDGGYWKKRLNTISNE